MFFYYLFITSSVASREPRRNLERSSPSPRDPFSFALHRSLASRSESISDLNAGKGIVRQRLLTPNFLATFARLSVVSLFFFTLLLSNPRYDRRSGECLYICICEEKRKCICVTKRRTRNANFDVCTITAESPLGRRNLARIQVLSEPIGVCNIYLHSIYLQEIYIYICIQSV